MGRQRKSIPLPSIASLRAFEASSRLLSFTSAAHELSQTQGAISHQIRDLEARLDQQLFNRLPKGITLTVTGQQYLPYAREALDKLYEAERIIRRPNTDNVLTVSCFPNFAHKWLAPSIGDFLSQQPLLDLRIFSSSEPVDFRAGEIDIAIRHGDGCWPDLEVTRLCREKIFPVCSPDMQPPWGSDKSVEELRAYTLLHDQKRDKWSRWLRKIGANAADFNFEAGPVFSQSSLAIDSAVAGQGIALARTTLVALDLKAGRLIRPTQEDTDADSSYWIVCPKDCELTEKTVLFKQWLLGLMQAG